MPIFNHWYRNMIYLYSTLIFVCVYFGVNISRRFSIRNKFYIEFLDFLKVYEENLNFRQDNYRDLAEKFIGTEESEFKSLLKSLCLGGVERSYEFFSKKEIDAAKAMLYSLGHADEYTEGQVVKHLQFLVRERCNITKEKKDKYSTLSIKISLLMGLLLVILLL